MDTYVKSSPSSIYRKRPSKFQKQNKTVLNVTLTISLECVLGEKESFCVDYEVTSA